MRIFRRPPSCLAALLLLCACATPPGKEASPVRAQLAMASPYSTAGNDVSVRLSLTSESGRGLDPAMLDAGCFRIREEGGTVKTPAAEGIPSRRLELGSRAELARTVNLGGVLRGAPTQTVEIWWEHGGQRSESIQERVYAFDLDEIEAVIETNKGDMTAIFYPKIAPITVKNFVDLCLKGFYDGLTFHRVVKGFMIQGGCPNGDGTGDPGYFIPGEFNEISHERGVLSMARSDDPDSAGCQFFIMHADNPGLDGLYAAFGRLVDGYDTLDRLAETETTHQRYGNEMSRPVESLVIEKITLRARRDASDPK